MQLLCVVNWDSQVNVWFYMHMYIPQQCNCHIYCACIQMQKHKAGLHLEQDPALNQFTWMMYSVMDQKEISPNVLVQLDITVVITKMLASSVEVKIGRKASCMIL